MAKTSNKRSLTIARHRTSVSLEAPFWDALADIAKAQGKSVAGLVSEIDQERSGAARNATSLSAAIRLYILKNLRARAT